MSEHIHKTLELVVAQVADHEQQAAQKRQMANNLCDLAGIPHVYPDEQAMGSSLGPLTPDAYYGKALAKVVRQVLERRKRAGLGAATVNEIYDAMKEGGYHFATKNDENAKRGLYISLSKNTSVFHRLPNGTYGLLEWYPNAKPAAVTNGKSKATEQTAEEDEEAGGDEELSSEAVVAEPAGGPKNPLAQKAGLATR